MKKSSTETQIPNSKFQIPNRRNEAAKNLKSEIWNLEFENPLRYIVQNLERTFGEPVLRPRSEPLAMLISVILSQATTDALSERTFDALTAKYKNWEAALAADEAEIADTIKLGGLANQKAKVIKELLINVKAEQGTLDLSFLQDLSTREAVTYLKKFRGIGPKTIACTLLFACHKNIFPLDTHIFRVLRRVGIVPPRVSDERAHEILDRVVPDGKFYSLHVNLIRLGRQICRPQEPVCERCPIVEYCDYGQSRI